MRYSVTVIVVLAAAVVLSPAFPNRLLAASDRGTYAGQELGTQMGARGANDTKEEVGDAKESKESHEVPARRLVESKRERRTYRINNWISGLEGDKERIYKKYGHPSGRFREEVMGTVVEKWVYSDKGKTFTFKGSKLVH